MESFYYETVALNSQLQLIFSWKITKNFRNSVLTEQPGMVAVSDYFEMVALTPYKCFTEENLFGWYTFININVKL